MHSYSSYVRVHHVSHPSLRHHTLKCLDPFYTCLSTLCWPLAQRYIVTLMTMIGITIDYMQRMCLSVMMMEMVKPSKKGAAQSCPDIETNFKSSGTFDWSTELQGGILASFYYGYSITHIPGGVISDLWGGKHIFGGTVLLTSLCSLLTPFMARLDPYALFCLRIIMGLAQGPLFPSVSSLVAHWAPPDERAFINTLTNSGVPMGLVFGNLLSGVFVATWPPWDNTFYIYAAMGGVWWIFWVLLVTPTPANHPFMKERERDYILENIYSQSHQITGGIPWVKILTSKYFWMTLIANLGHEMGLFFVSTELPIYLRNVNRLPIEMNGIASAIPWVAMWLGSVLFAELAIQLEKKKIVSKLFIRRSFTVPANIIPGIVIALTIYVGCNHWYVVLVMSVANFLKGSIFACIRCSLLDITPNFSGIAMAIVSGVAGLSGFGIPLFVHSFIADGGRFDEWELPIFVCCGIMILFTLPYMFCITTDEQPWNEGTPRHAHRESPPPRHAKSAPKVQ